MEKELAKLNFKELIDYPEISGYSNHKPFKCSGFCKDCEEKHLLIDGEKLERMSHGADSSDFAAVFGKPYSSKTPNDTRVMFVMKDPPPSTQEFYESITYDGITKEIPTKSYYWIQDYVTKPVTHDAIMKGSVYDLYWWYLQERFSLSNIYITNLIKCYSNTYNKNEFEKFNAQIQNNCIERFLLKEIELFKPSVIFCMGSYVSNHPLWKRLRKEGICVETLKHISLIESYHKDKEQILNQNDLIIETALKGF
jgi:hypothetical protein